MHHSLPTTPTLPPLLCGFLRAEAKVGTEVKPLGYTFNKESFSHAPWAASPGPHELGGRWYHRKLLTFPVKNCWGGGEKII